MLSENVETFLTWFESILLSGVIGYGFYFSMTTILETKIRENFLPIIMNIERRDKK